MFLPLVCIYMCVQYIDRPSLRHVLCCILFGCLYANLRFVIFYSTRSNRVVTLVRHQHYRDVRHDGFEHFTPSGMTHDDQPSSLIS